MSALPPDPAIESSRLAPQQQLGVTSIAGNKPGCQV